MAAAIVSSVAAQDRAATALLRAVAPAEPRAMDLTMFARAVQPGEVVRLDVTCDCDLTSPHVTAFGRDVALFPVGSGGHWRGLVAIDLDTLPGAYAVSARMPAGGRVQEYAGGLQVSAKQFPTRRLTVAPAYVEPPASTVERILREAAQLDALFAGVAPRAWDGPFSAPLTTPASNNFGARSVFNGESRNPHGGIDYRSPTGTRVTSPGGGRIALAADLYFTGNTVIVDHGLGLFSVLAHLSAMTVAEGDQVDRGSVIGRVGATGRATGPHLHWGVRLHGARVDPLSLIAATR